MTSSISHATDGRLSCCTPTLPPQANHQSNRPTTATSVYQNPCTTVSSTHQGGIPSVFWLSLFPEYICGYLNVVDILHMAQVCRILQTAASLPQIWRQLLKVHLRMSSKDCAELDRIAHADHLNRYGDELRMLSRSHCVVDAVLHQTSDRAASLVLITPPPTVSSYDNTKQRSFQAQATTVVPSRSKCSPLRTMSRDAPSSYGATPTPPRQRTTVAPSQRIPHFVPAAFTNRSLGNSPMSMDLFPVRATIHQLLASVSADVEDLPSSYTEGSEANWAVEWREVEQRPASVSMLLGSSTTLTSAEVQRTHQFVSHEEEPLQVAADGIIVEPLVTSSDSADYTDASMMQHEETMLLDSIRLAAEGSYSDAEADAGEGYSSGALVLGSQHHLLTELWDVTVASMDIHGTQFHGVIGEDEHRHISRSTVRGESTSSSDSSNQGPALVSRRSLDRSQLICGTTARWSLKHDCQGYPFQRLFIKMYTKRVHNFVSMLSARRDDSVRAITYEDLPQALQLLTCSIQNVIEGGCGRSNVIREALVVDLLLRGRVFRALRRDDDALGDFALAFLLDPDCQEAYIESSVITTSAERCSVNASKILSPMFDLDAEYDQILVSGKSLVERAAFLFEVGFWRGPTLMLYLYQYFLCDVIKVWPVRLLLAAEERAESACERLMVRAWILYDSGNSERALEAAEMAGSMLPADVSRTIDEVERTSLEIVKCVASDVFLQALEQSEAYRRACSCDVSYPKVADIRSMLRSMGDVSDAALLVPSFTCLLDFWYDEWLPLSNGAQRSSVSPMCVPVTASFVLFTQAFLGGEGDMGLEGYRKHLYTRPVTSRVATALSNVGYLFLQRHPAQPSAALTLFEQAVRLYPHHARANYNAARCYIQAGRIRDAYTAFSRVIDHTNDIEPRAEALFERSRISAHPLPDLMESTKRDPRYSNPYRLRAAMSMDRGNAEEALRELSSIVDITMDASDIALKALFRRDTGDVEGAIADMALACSLMPTRTDFRTTLTDLVSEVVTDEEAEDAMPFTRNPTMQSDEEGFHLAAAEDGVAAPMEDEDNDAYAEQELQTLLSELTTSTDQSAPAEVTNGGVHNLSATTPTDQMLTGADGETTTLFPSAGTGGGPRIPVTSSVSPSAEERKNRAARISARVVEAIMKAILWE